MRTPILPLVLAATPILGARSLADTIYLTDGKSISDVSIQAERLDQVVYRKDKKTDSVESDKVLFVEFSSKPQLVDRADTAVDEDNPWDALDDLKSFLDGLEKAPRRWPWSRAYALYRVVEINGLLGQLQDVVAAADRLAELEPDSRYIPFAHVKKAEALYDGGKGQEALKAIGELGGVVKSRQLSQRWKLEHELRTILYDDSITGSKRQKRLEDISSRAGARYPVVHNRAEVALGEALLLQNKVAGAEKIFKAVTGAPRADDRTLAAAYSGLGACLWLRGEPRASEEAGKALLRQALLAYMRVVVVYKNELLYRPRAMFFAGRCFQLLGGEGANDKATKLYTKLMRTFPQSSWAQEAKGFRNRQNKSNPPAAPEKEAQETQETQETQEAEEDPPKKPD